MKKLAIVYLAHDGFASLYSGVGTVARDFLLSFPDVSLQLREKYPDADLTLYVGTMKYNETSFALSVDVRDATRQFVSEHDNICFVELHNGSAAQDAYGTFENWKHASISAATFLYTIANDFDEVLAVCVDTPFVQVANRFIDTYSDIGNVQFIWLPQSTVKIHGYGMSSFADQQGDAYVNQRYDWEEGVIALAKREERVRIGCVGQFMKEHLIADYQAAPETLIDLHNSLYMERLRKNVHTQVEIREFLSEHDIPLDRPILFSFGRAEPYKGLDLVLQNSLELIDKHGYFVLIFAAPYSMDDPYLKVLDKLATERPEDVKVIYGMSFTAPHYVMQWANTRILAILSRAEPFGLIPIESRFYNNPSLTLVVSAVDGLRFQVADGQDGYLTAPSDEAIRKTLNAVAEMDDRAKEQIAQNGYDRVMEEYNQINVNVSMLDHYVSDMLAA